MPKDHINSDVAMHAKCLLRLPRVIPLLDIAVYQVPGKIFFQKSSDDDGKLVARNNVSLQSEYLP